MNENDEFEHLRSAPRTMSANHKRKRQASEALTDTECKAPAYQFVFKTVEDAEIFLRGEPGASTKMVKPNLPDDDFASVEGDKVHELACRVFHALLHEHKSPEGLNDGGAEKHEKSQKEALNFCRRLLQDADQVKRALAISMLVVDTAKRIHKDGVPSHKLKRDRKQTKTLSNYIVDLSLIFSARVDGIVEAISVNKLVAKDVLSKGFSNRLEDLALAPQDYLHRKVINNQTNCKRPDRSSQPKSAKPSKLNKVQPFESMMALSETAPNAQTPVTITESASNVYDSRSLSQGASRKHRRVDQTPKKVAVPQAGARQVAATVGALRVATPVDFIINTPDSFPVNKQKQHSLTPSYGDFINSTPESYSSKQQLPPTPSYERQHSTLAYTSMPDQSDEQLTNALRDQFQGNEITQVNGQHQPMFPGDQAVAYEQCFHQHIPMTSYNSQNYTHLMASQHLEHPAYRNHSHHGTFQTSHPCASSVYESHLENQLSTSGADPVAPINSFNNPQMPEVTLSGDAVSGAPSEQSQQDPDWETMVQSLTQHDIDDLIDQSAATLGHGDDDMGARGTRQGIGHDFGNNEMDNLGLDGEQPKNGFSGYVQPGMEALMDFDFEGQQ
ncbi:hypothetical protein MBLNU230_g2293t1 [Neophaeotheca triangularis]